MRKADEGNQVSEQDAAPDAIKAEAERLEWAVADIDTKEGAVAILAQALREAEQRGLNDGDTTAYDLGYQRGLTEGRKEMEHQRDAATDAAVSMEAKLFKARNEGREEGARAEREACAKLMAGPDGDGLDLFQAEQSAGRTFCRWVEHAQDQCDCAERAAAIRARSEEP